jgi:Trp operon repressor
MHRNGRSFNSRKNDLISVFLSIRDHASMEKFFREIFTGAEQKDLSLRWELMKRLYAHTPQRAIASELGVSLCKITRGAKIINNKHSITNKLLMRQGH